MTNMHEECLLTFLAKKTLPNHSAVKKNNHTIPAATKASTTTAQSKPSGDSLIAQADTFENTTT